MTRVAELQLQFSPNSRSDAVIGYRRIAIVTYSRLSALLFGTQQRAEEMIERVIGWIFYFAGRCPCRLLKRVPRQVVLNLRL
jgi:hypothetical protein